VKRCRVLHLQGLGMMLGSSRAADLRAAAALAHMLTARLPKEYAQRLAVRGSDIVPAMVALLGERDAPSVIPLPPSHLLLPCYLSLARMQSPCCAALHQLLQ
jgi:hypothetical protein